jgi:hypothetical protein
LAEEKVVKRHRSTQPKFKTFNNKEKEDKQRRKEMQGRLKEHIEEKREHMRIQDYDLKTAEPIPRDRRTFSAIAQRTKKHPPKPRGPKGPHFGRAPRFGHDQKKKWSKEVRNYNDANPDREVPLDPKNDKMPGPGRYETLEVWPGKKPHKKSRRKKKPTPFIDAPKIGQRPQSAISKGTTFSIYHSRR